MNISGRYFDHRLSQEQLEIYCQAAISQSGFKTNKTIFRAVFTEMTRLVVSFLTAITLTAGKLCSRFRFWSLRFQN